MAAQVLSITVGTGAGPEPWKFAAVAQVTDAVAVVAGDEVFDGPHASSVIVRAPRNKSGRAWEGLILCMAKYPWARDFDQPEARREYYAQFVQVEWLRKAVDLP